MKERLPFKLFTYNFNGENVIKKIVIKDLKSDIRLNSHNKYYTPVIISPVGDIIICHSHYDFYYYIKKESQRLYSKDKSIYEVYLDLWANNYVTVDISYNNFGKMENIYYSNHKIFKMQYNILELLAIYLECNLIEINYKKLYQDSNNNNLQVNYLVNNSYMTHKYEPPWNSYK